MKWLLNHRTDFESNGWDQLCGNTMKYGVMSGHHVSFDSSVARWTISLTSSQFSMMKDPHASSLGKLIREGLDWKP